MVPEAPPLPPQIDVEEKTDEVVETMPPWKVILHNDDVTTFDFVTWLLVTLFGKSAAEAVRLTFEIHTGGLATVCVTSFERAELYVEQVHALARPRGFPLSASIEAA